MDSEAQRCIVDLVDAAFSPELMQFIYDHRTVAYSHTIGFRYLGISVERTPRAQVTNHLSMKVCVFCPLARREVVSQHFPPELFGIDPHYEFGIQGAAKLQLFKQEREPIYVCLRRIRGEKDPHRALLDIVELLDSLTEELQRSKQTTKNSSWE